MQKAVIFRVKEGYYETWKNWCIELNTTLSEEAHLSLEEEEVFQELTLGFIIDDVHYILGFMDGECLPANMDRDINRRHKEMKKQCFERVSEAEVLYNLRR